MVCKMRLLQLFFFFIETAKTDKNIVPVLVIDDIGVTNHTSVAPNPFTKISTSYFAGIIHNIIKRSEMVIIFVENEFSMEDVTIKDELGSPYEYLHKELVENKLKFFPLVIEPYKLLNEIFPPQLYNVFHLNQNTKLQFDGHFKYFYVFFQDGRNESRADVLRKHDQIMREVYLLISKLSPGPVVAFYTGKTNPAELRLQLVPVSPIKVKDPGVMVTTQGGLFRFVGMYATTPLRRSTVFNQLPTVAEESRSPHTLTTRMAYTDIDLEFNFSFKDNGWMLEYVALFEGGEEVGRTVMQVGARWNTAYYCGEPLVIINNRDGSSVTISEYQIQPLRRRRSSISLRDGDDSDDDGSDSEGGGGGGEGGGEGGEGGGSVDNDGSVGFSDTVHCGPYFSASILSGLLVCSVLSLILAFGVAVLFDARANDRLDDPQGKPLLITAEATGH